MSEHSCAEAYCTQTLPHHTHTDADGRCWCCGPYPYPSPQGAPVIENDGGMVVARITIERKVMPDGSDRVDALFSDGDDENGKTPPAVELLGMLQMSVDTVLHGGIYDDEDDA